MTIQEELDDLIKIQCSNGNWNYDPYMHGLANGLIIANSVASGEDPEFLKAPEIWLRDLQEEEEPINPNQRTLFDC